MNPLKKKLHKNWHRKVNFFYTQFTKLKIRQTNRNILTVLNENYLFNLMKIEITEIKENC